MADRSSNKPVVSGANSALEQLKYEVANELGATLGPDRSARENGSVGGEMTKRLVSFAEQNLKSKQI
ncbi:small acid-soluble spore protein alpha/beta type [Syntrophobotulus glycolicus DSM 8271]|uniref:Small acid-soluble spore protein alpha/beta type n=1 Tax=Syntrophobotulus glycolicus (strain DSM 8271 / FlGlyR) TaxID=645991 RepID=F0T042_SYNGF|nr:alpha/beta-type small acid-soluble spore protein [Syntrophobotulus glycolicus]ADY56129.1 small acid-soluble spore protein alpha/beta type [Syntrophobotulus glycolicus DSM 8271]